MILGMGIIAVFLLLFFLSRKEKSLIPQKTQRIFYPFYKITVFLFYRSGWYWRFLEKSEKVKKYLQALHPNEKNQQACREYYFSKFSVMLMIVFVGAVFSVFVCLAQESKLKDGNIIIRNPLGTGSEEIRLQITGETGDSKGRIEYQVLPEQYTKQELEELYKEFLPILEKTILGNNTDRNYIREDMNLVSGLGGYPFTIEWSTSDYTLLNYEGKRKREEISVQGELLELTAEISCEELKKIYTCFVRVFPAEMSEQEKFLHHAKKELAKSEEEQKYNSEWELPKTIAGEKVTWVEEQPASGTLLLVLSVLTAVIIFFQKDNDLKKQVRKKEQEMLEDYTSVISRMTLYMNAGMPIRSAWYKVAGSRNIIDDTKKRYIYEEMKLTCYEMDSGIPEVEAYERFGKRCALQPYIKLTTLLVQNVKKGNSVLLERLKEETQLAILERKNKIKTAAEEAGTKLLVPMMLMLAVVMILIMVPALNSF